MAALVREPGDIRLGMIGMTEGNGHPFSWSAIVNRYDPEVAKDPTFAYPGIAAYLGREDLETMGIPGVRVVAVCCNDRKDAEEVARFARVPAVLEHPEEMIGLVDAVCIATDIGSQHVERAKPFLAAGIPVFIDKPLCDNLADLEFFRQAVAGGAKILSSSCMRYAKELMPYHHGKRREIGELRGIFMNMSKKWETYGIHALEAIYPIAGPGFVSVRNSGSEKRNIVHLKHRDGFDAVIGCFYDAAYGPSINLIGTTGQLRLTSQDTYGTFRRQLVSFIDYLRSGELPYPFAETDELMQLVIGGILSRERGGEEISLPF